MKDDQPWIQHYRANGVVLNETDYGYGPVFILGDDLTEKEQQYVIKISPSRPDNGRRLAVAVALQWSDKQPGEIADYTLQPESSSLDCAPGELEISDNGLLSMMARQDTASSIHYCCGWTLQLPIAYVEPTRQAIAMAIAALPKE
ncbi:hypothetical protein [Pseudomonas aeruginosa]|uniref:hypothetical protein n=1 Tax=Pseudomonas aeruginosa TaxID=287 RepID=UPI003CC5E607